MSKPRITGAMLRPRVTEARPSAVPAKDDKPAEAAAHHEAVASHPSFVAPQFGYRRAVGAPSERASKPPRLPRVHESG